MDAVDPPTPLLTMRVDVEPRHIDELDHVNNTVYVQWAQDIGVKHWRAVASLEVQSRFVWVARRLEVDFHRESKLGETLVVDTWLGAPHGARWPRHVRISGPDTKTRAAIVTHWALLDADKRRPARIPDEIKRLFGTS